MQKILTYVVLCLVSLSTGSTAFASAPVCNNASSDPDGDGWGWENNQSCVLVVNTSEAPNNLLSNPSGSPDAQAVLAVSEDYAFVKADNVIQVLKRNGTSWSNDHLITDTHTNFGCSADINGSMAAVGSCEGNVATVYRVENNGRWEREVRLTPLPIDNGTMTVAVRAPRVAVALVPGQSRFNPYANPFEQTGNVSIYRSYSGNWNREAFLEGTDMIAGFGNGVAFIDDRNLAVGRALSISGLTCQEGSSASGCVVTRIARERLARGGIGIYHFSDTENWDHIQLPQPTYDGNIRYAGDAIAANHDTIVFHGIDTDTLDAVLYVYKKQSDNTWLVSGSVTAAQLEIPVYYPPDLELSSDGQNMSFAFSSESTDSDSEIHTFIYNDLTGFSASGVIDQVNHMHAAFNDSVLAVRAGQVGVFRSSVNEQPNMMPVNNGCDYSSADLYNGWGWNATLQLSCPPVNVCIDTDGDGWGWDGTASCRVPGMTPPTGPTEVPACTTTTSDPDGDGWGWENNASCVTTAVF